LGSQNVGGLIGYTRALGIVVNSFWDTQASGQPTSAGGTGKTTAQMKTKSTFADAGWDFDLYYTWAICEGVNYPVLRWQIPVGDISCPDGVNFIDYAWFVLDWQRDGCNSFNWYCYGLDLDLSGSVGFDDLAIFAEDWLEGIR
jgi:hypothetical protein